MTDNGSAPAIKRDSLRRWFGLASTSPSRKDDWFHSPPAVDRSESPIITAARSLPHGAVCSDDLRRAIDEEIVARRTAKNMLDGPASPKTATELTVRRDGMPDWWTQNGHLLLCGPDLGEVRFGVGMLSKPSYRSLVVIGAGVILPSINVMREDALIVVGDNCRMLSSSIGCGNATVLVGEETTATWMASIDARNGGIVVAGRDGMWAAGSSMMTDDTHAIRDAETGKRINKYGGRIMLGDHVWLGEQTKLMGDCRIGDDCVVGMGSFVKNVALPPNTVSVGRPARPIRSGVTWSRQDLP